MPDVAYGGMVMKLWQKIGLVVACIALFIGAIIGVVFYATSGITDTADEFFAAAAEGDYDTANGLLSTQLQGELDRGIRPFLAFNGIEKVVEKSWSSRSIENDVGRLEGTVTTAEGGKIALTMQFISENGEWKIDGIEIAPRGLQSGGGGMAIPSVDEQERLIARATQGLMNTLRTDDFEGFNSEWVNGMDPADLRAGLGALPQEVLDAMFMTQPEFTPASALNERGFLVLDGVYRTDKGNFKFSYSFMDQGGQTKLIAMDIEQF